MEFRSIAQSEVALQQIHETEVVTMKSKAELAMDAKVILIPPWEILFHW